MTRQPRREDEPAHRSDDQPLFAAAADAFAGGAHYRELIERYAHIVKAVVNRLDHCLPPEVDRGVLIGKAIMALVDTAHQTPPGDFFEQQARSNIWKTIVGWLGEQPWLRRRLKQSADRLYEAYVKALQRMEHTRRSTDAPLAPGVLAEELQVTETQLEQWLNEVSAYFTAWPRSFLGVEDTVETLAAEHDIRGAGFQPAAVDREATDQHDIRGAGFQPAAVDRDGTDSRSTTASHGTAQLASAISKLPPRGRLVVTLSHYEELSHDEIAAIMDVPVLEVSRTYAEAGLQLRAILADAA